MGIWELPEKAQECVVCEWYFGRKVVLYIAEKTDSFLKYMTTVGSSKFCLPFAPAIGCSNIPSSISRPYIQEMKKVIIIRNEFKILNDIKLNL